MTAGTASPGAGSARLSRRARFVFFVLFFVGILALWEGVKVLGGDPFRVDGVVVWMPPLDIGMASDINLPHVWIVFERMFQPLTSGAEQTLACYLFDQALYTLRSAFIGF
ncbi:MAG TPA: hypothetical protein VFP83_05920, partial [Candidatus Limnocylindria bacterium]|nr:hypothetical protein [Candidatus Limnocylindria bacterium]